jgi:hypothetical protein
MNPEDLGCKATLCMYLPGPPCVMVGLLFLPPSGSVFAIWKRMKGEKIDVKKRIACRTTND